uniref:SDR family NAD(P)-dependent oxidoreductase n=1 Tax=Candidatus Electrothrix sp. TaxID=2170559 RepID=UPI004055BA3C
MSSQPIAIIGLACHYPGAKDLCSFWENILTKRRQFRPLPDDRLPRAVYYDPDPAAPDKTYCSKAGLIEDFFFDLVKYRVPKSSFDSTDTVHWLALQIALAALKDAGFTKESVPRERTGVILGNTLTGEHTRSEGLRLRWPFVSRVLQAAAQAERLSPAQTANLLNTSEAYYKSVFAPITEDTLAGALSNTIAGRICNSLDLHGGGYTVDGACSSSVIAAATAANALSSGDLNLAFAGGVDISLDTLELVGFAKTAALTRSDMRVYDRRADGFLPGEGCGFVVMQRLSDAVAEGRYVYAVLHGWGISSDGKGSLTAPNAEGQAKALRRAYERAGWKNPPDFIEGHGTGTAVGDTAELEAAATVLQEMNSGFRQCGITSLKSIIGHTKAASGIGALIKAVIAVNRRVIPPTANCSEPHPVFTDKAAALYPVLNGEILPEQSRLRAGVSGMGFGGINCHLALESGDAPSPELRPALEEQKLLAAHQHTEIFLFSAPTNSELLAVVQEARNLGQDICEGELTDLAAHIMDRHPLNYPVRAAVLADSPESLLENLAQLEAMLRDVPPELQQTRIDTLQGICIGNAVQQHRAGFLFPGQGSQQLNMSQQLVLRHDWGQELVNALETALERQGEKLSKYIFKPVENTADALVLQHWQKELKQTEIAQPAICLASLLWLEKLARLGIRPDAVGGHSLGELTAFHAAGAYSGEELIRFAALRGQVMAPAPNAAGTMASLACSAVAAQAILDKTEGYAVLANLNSPRQTVISGAKDSIEQACMFAHKQGITTRKLPVATAFHSEFVASAADQLAKTRVLPETLETVTATLFTGIRGEEVRPGLDLIRHFSDQIISPVDFITLLQGMRTKCDLILEVGPGRVLSGLANTTIKPDDPPVCFPVESRPGQDRDLNLFLAVYFVHGGTVNREALYADRLVRPFRPVSERSFLSNPCERPFPVQPMQPAAPPECLPEQTNQTELLLAESAGISPEILSAYLRERGRFIGQVIKADLDSRAEQDHIVPAPFSDISDSPSPSSPALKPGKALLTDAATEKISAADLLLDLIEQRTGFPQDSLSLEFRLLDDLNLDSIKASELIAEAASKSGVAATDLNVAEYANAKVSEIVEALETEQTKGNSDHESAPTAFYPSWVRDFSIVYSSEPFLEVEDGDWRDEQILVLSEPKEMDLAQKIAHFFSTSAATVECALFEVVRNDLVSFLNRFTIVIALLPQQPTNQQTESKQLPEHVARLHTVFANSFYTADHQNNTLAVVQFGGGFFGNEPVVANIEQCSAVALSASIHLEQPALKVRVLDCSPDISSDSLSAVIAQELSTPETYTAVGYDADLIRRTPRPVLRNKAEYRPRKIIWSQKDVVLVTGGAKGITAECALEFTRTKQVKMALTGSSPVPNNNEENNPISETLQRYDKAGLSACYYQCDITDAESVNKLVQEVNKRQGAITGIIHGSALNRPETLAKVSVQQALVEVSPKLKGAINLWNALQDAPPKIFIAFSSLIGFSGMMRNGWYGFSNEALNLILQQYGKKFQETSVLSIAFSVWDEVGMGVRMGSTGWLARKGIDAIPVKEGVAHFMRFLDHDPGEQQIIVTARTAGLDTFIPASVVPLSKGLRFLEKITTYYPDIEVSSRVYLTLERDPYIKDHVWRGTYLFPLVFGLEAMAQVVRAVTGREDFNGVCIQNIELERPITVSENTPTEIEIHAETVERDNIEAPQHVHVQIRTEHSGFKVDHFSATFVLNKDSTLLHEEIPKQRFPLEVSPHPDLYHKDMLFQGPLFQRIRQVYYLSSETCLVKAALHPDKTALQDWTWHLGSPFLRDALLQAGQLLIPQELSLPKRINSIERFTVDSTNKELLWVRADIEERTDKYIFGTVILFNEKGQVVERIKGYLAKFIEHRDDLPTIDELVNPGQRDTQIIRKVIRQKALLVNFTAPEISSGYIPHIRQLNKEKRHEQETPLLQQAATRLLDAPDAVCNIAWSASGKPYIKSPNDTGINISLTHNGGTVVCTAGQGPQGCDLETVSSRGKEDWIAVLGKKYLPLLNRLTETGPDSLHRAGTRIWTASEALFKASGQRPEFMVEKIIGDTILFQCNKGIPFPLYILTLPVQLTLNKERVFAVVAPAGNEQEEKTDEALQAALKNSSDEFTTSFIGSKGAGGKVYFTNIPVWMGKLRELALQPISEPLIQDMSSRKWGLVTNMSCFRVEQYLNSYDTVIGEIRLMDDTDLTNSVISLGLNWSKKQEDGSLERVVTAKLSTTWVSIEGYGIVKKAKLPEYFREYLSGLPTIIINSSQWLAENRLITSDLTPVFASDSVNQKKYFLDQQVFLTSLEDSNLVGNIYFSTYYSWQARVRDHYLFAQLPEIFQQGDVGEFTCVHAEVNHLQEAMPFETIEVSMYLNDLFEEGFTLYFEYYSVPERGGRKKKLAHGLHTAIWTLTSVDKTVIRPLKMPEKILKNLSGMTR